MPNSDRAGFLQDLNAPAEAETTNARNEVDVDEVDVDDMVHGPFRPPPTTDVRSAPASTLPTATTTAALSRGLSDPGSERTYSETVAASLPSTISSPPGNLEREQSFDALDLLQADSEDDSSVGAVVITLKDSTDQDIGVRGNTPSYHRSRTNIAKPGRVAKTPSVPTTCEPENLAMSQSFHNNPTATEFVQEYLQGLEGNASLDVDDIDNKLANPKVGLRPGRHDSFEQSAAALTAVFSQVDPEMVSWISAPKSPCEPDGLANPQSLHSPAAQEPSNQDNPEGYEGNDSFNLDSDRSNNATHHYVVGGGSTGLHDSFETSASVTVSRVDPARVRRMLSVSRNCAPDDLTASQNFGHATSAHTPGLVEGNESPHGNTLFGSDSTAASEAVRGLIRQKSRRPKKKPAFQMQASAPTRERKAFPTDKFSGQRPEEGPLKDQPGQRPGAYNVDVIGDMSRRSATHSSNHDDLAIAQQVEDPEQPLDASVVVHTADAEHANSDNVHRLQLINVDDLPSAEVIPPKRRWGQTAWILIVLAMCLPIAIVVGAVCGSGLCTEEPETHNEKSNEALPQTEAPTIGTPTDYPTLNNVPIPITNDTVPTSLPTSEAPSFVPSDLPTKAPSFNPTVSSAPTRVASFSPSGTKPTTTPSTPPTSLLSTTPSDPPTTSPTSAPPTSLPSAPPSKAPSREPTTLPSTRPTVVPTSSPTVRRFFEIFQRPTAMPVRLTRSPTRMPTPKPTVRPTLSPTTKQPTPNPTSSPSKQPTFSPTSSAPTPRPTPEPSDIPTLSPTTKHPTPGPTPTPSKQPTPVPTKLPTPVPTQFPTPGPTKRPTSSPTPNPTKRPTPHPTKSPTPRPTQQPFSSFSVTLSPRATPRPTPHPTLPPFTPPPNFRPWTCEQVNVPGSSFHGQWFCVYRNFPFNEVGIESALSTVCPTQHEVPSRERCMCYVQIDFPGGHQDCNTCLLPSGEDKGAFYSSFDCSNLLVGECVGITENRECIHN